MLRKEMKEAAQRALKGSYGNWAPFVILPVVVLLFSFFIGLNAFRVADTSYQEDNGEEYPYQEPGDDFFDGEYEDYYTPAYNYGFALGTKAGYLKGWQDGLAGIGDGDVREDEEDILDSIKERPFEFLESNEFEQGILNAYSYHYTEAWTDSQDYQQSTNNLSAKTTGNLLVPQRSLPPMKISASGLGDFPNESPEPYQRTTRSHWLFNALFPLILVLVLIAAAFYQVFYAPLLQWAAMDTIDGEKVHVKESIQNLFTRLEVTTGANLKIFFFSIGWGLLLIIPGVIKHCGYSMTNYLLKREPKLDSSKAIALSQELMKGYKIEYLIFNGSYFLWSLATAYSLGFAGFYTIPYYETARILFFDEIYYEKRTLQSSSEDIETGFENF